jgi:hypothetical protein
LLQETSSFDLALSSVRIFLEGCGGDAANDAIGSASHSDTKQLLDIETHVSVGDAKYRIFFDKLEKKFPVDPEHTSIRLVHLKFAYSFSLQSVASTERVTQTEESDR